jgi:hypothetical protein
MSSHGTYNIASGRSISSPVALFISVTRKALPVFTIEPVIFYPLSRELWLSSGQGKYKHGLSSNRLPSGKSLLVCLYYSLSPFLTRILVSVPAFHVLGLVMVPTAERCAVELS